jgi:leucyl-tRNA synthetase
VQLVSPFAPHIAEELWSGLGGSPSIVDAGWASDDERLVVEVRGTIRVPATATQEDAVAAVMAEPGIARFVTGPF